MSVQEQTLNPNPDTNLWFKVLPWLICGLAAGFYFYEYLLRVSPGVMQPELMSLFGISAAKFGHLSAFYFYAYTPMQLAVGVLMDRYGPRRILTIAVFCCAVGTFIFGISNTFMMAAAGRFLIGFGSAFAFVGVLKLATIWLPANKFAMISGLTTTLGMVGAISGQNLLSRLVLVIGWSDTILYSGVIGFILIPVIWFVVRDERSDTKQTKALAEHTSFMMLFDDIKIILSNKQIWINGLVGLFIIFPTTVFGELWGIPFLKVAYGFDEKTAAAAISMIFVGWAFGGPIAGYLSDRLCRRCIPMMIGSIFGLICIASVIYIPDLPQVAIYGLLFLFGAFSAAEVIVFAVGRENSPTSTAGTAVAFTNCMVVVAGFFMFLPGKILDLLWDGTKVDALRIYTLENYHTALLMMPASFVIAFLLCILLKETRCVPQYD